MQPEEIDSLKEAAGHASEYLTPAEAVAMPISSLALKSPRGAGTQPSSPDELEEGLRNYQARMLSLLGGMLDGMSSPIDAIEYVNVHIGVYRALLDESLNFYKNRPNEKDLLEKVREVNKSADHLIGTLYNRIYLLVEYYIDKSSHSFEQVFQVKLKILEQFAKLYGGERVAEYARILFQDMIALPEKGARNLPTSPPELWQGLRENRETPPDFIKRVYGEYQGKGLTKQLIKQLDPKLYTALYSWISRGNRIPDDLKLPSLEEYNQQLAEDIRKAEAEGTDHPALSILREGRRLESILRRHDGKDK